MLKIRRPLGRLIFNMGIAIPGKTVFLIETAPWLFTPLFHEKYGSGFTRVFLKLVLRTAILSNSHEFRWVPQNANYNESTFIKVMAWCRQATIYYPNQCRSSQFSTDDVAGSQCVKCWLDQLNNDVKDALISDFTQCQPSCDIWCNALLIFNGCVSTN